MSARRPAYPRSEVQDLVRAGSYRVTVTAARTAGALGFDRDEIIACVLELTDTDFYKSMEAEAVPGLWQDVYRPWRAGLQLYVKVQINAAHLAVVISFKER